MAANILAAAWDQNAVLQVASPTGAELAMVSRGWLVPLRALRPCGRPQGAARHALRRTRRSEGGVLRARGPLYTLRQAGGMPFQTVFVRKARHFVPSEASVAAGELRCIALDSQRVATRLRGIVSLLESSWEGNSRVRFLDAFDWHPPAAESSAAWFEAQAGHVGSITVTVWETEPQTVWTPDA